MAMNRKGMNKKGIFFTFIAIGLVSLLVYSFVIYTGYVYRDSMFVIETRVGTVESFIKDVETDINRGLYISSFRSILAIQNYMITNNSFIPDIEAVFEEALINGTVMNTTNQFIENASFTDWADRIKEHANRIDIVFNIETSNITIVHKTPWALVIEMDVILNITDGKKIASWYKVNHIETILKVEGLEDPIYSLNTLGKVTNKVVRANETDFNDFDVLKIHLMQSYYIANNRSPSFLMRLEGNLSNSSMGIESIVNIDKIKIQGLTPKITSSVDHIYFSNMTVSSCLVNQTVNKTGYDWFRLDDSDNYHLDFYEVECI